jgi:hypothetical protein
LPSARQKALGKDPFADGKFPDGSLPKAALGKAFAEGLIAFAEGWKPSANPLYSSATIISIMHDTHETHLSDLKYKSQID